MMTIERVRDSGSDEIKDVVFRAIDSIGYRSTKSVKLVLIKPNLCYYWDHTTGETTDPRVVSAIIDYVREKVNPEAHIKIVESDASAMRVEHAFLMLGYRKLAKEKDVELVNLSKEETIEKEIRIGDKQIKLTLAKILFEADLLINVPKLKVGPFADAQSPHITCALKNFFGLISTPEKFVYHKNLSEVIVAVNKLVMPDLVIVDGIIAKGKHPIKLGVILGARNNVSADVLASQIIGHNPKSIRHIRLAADEGLGKIETLTAGMKDMADLRSIFPKVNRRLFNMTWRIELFAVRAYAKLSGDVIPPVLD